MGTMATTTSLDTRMVDTTFNTATTSLCTARITDAENEIRKILSKRYDVSADAFQTSTSVPPMLTTLCEWLTMGFMYEDLSRGGLDGFGRSDRYIKKAMENLNDIVDYKVNLVNTSGSLISESTESLPMFSNTKDYTDTFAEDNPTNWAVDSDKLDDIADERD